MLEPEGATLRIPAYRRAVAGMDDLPTVCPHAFECGGQVRYREIRERDPVAGPRAASVYPELRSALVGLPAVALLLGPRRQIGAEHLSPEPERAPRIVGRELDEDDGSGHARTLSRSWNGSPLEEVSKTILERGRQL